MIAFPSVLRGVNPKTDFQDCIVCLTVLVIVVVLQGGQCLPAACDLKLRFFDMPL